MSNFRLAGLLLALGVALLAMPLTARAQGQPYRLDMITRLLEAGVSKSVILDRVRSACLASPLDAPAEARLSTAGADGAFIAALRATCVQSGSPAPVEAAPVEPARAETTPAATPVPAPAPADALAEPTVRPVGNPWSGYRVRAIGYGVVGLASAAALTVGKTQTSEFCDATDCYSRKVTTAPYKSIGMGGVAVAAGAAVVDWMMTARKARRAGVMSVGGKRDVLLALPAVTPDAGAVRIDAVRFRF